ncbi:wdr4-prov protein, putative, partial [Ixodes scapularis]
VIGEEDQFLAVCDRDEKIQVSRFPNCYNISTFCLGHTQFVSCLALLPNHPEVLVSGSGVSGRRAFYRPTLKMCST